MRMHTMENLIVGTYEKKKKDNQEMQFPLPQRLENDKDLLTRCSELWQLSGAILPVATDQKVDNFLFTRITCRDTQSVSVIAMPRIFYNTKPCKRNAKKKKRKLPLKIDSFPTLTHLPSKHKFP